MRHHHDNDLDRDRSNSVWAEKVHSGLIDEITPRRIAEIAALAGTVVVASTAVASAAGAAVSQGGIR